MKKLSMVKGQCFKNSESDTKKSEKSKHSHINESDNEKWEDIDKY